MKIIECSICGKPFKSYNGLQVCSEECRLERTRIQNKKGNYRRRKGISGTPERKICPICGKGFDSYHNMKYCNKECYLIAKRNKDKENFRIYYQNDEWKKKHIKKYRLPIDV